MTGRKSSYLELLQSMCVAQNRAIKTNQITILRFIETHVGVLSLCNTTEDKSKRIVMARDGDYNDDDSWLKYHLSFIDLLTAASAKRNEICQHICRRLVPLNVVMEVLNDEAMQTVIKIPYWKYLQSVFLDADANNLSSEEISQLFSVTPLIANLLSKIVINKYVSDVYMIIIRSRIANSQYICQCLLPCVDSYLNTFVNESGSLSSGELSRVSGSVIITANSLIEIIEGYVLIVMMIMIE